MTEPEKCPECGAKLEEGSFDVKGAKRTAYIEFSFCPKCGWESKQHIRYRRAPK